MNEGGGGQPRVILPQPTRRAALQIRALFGDGQAQLYDGMTGDKTKALQSVPSPLKEFFGCDQAYDRRMVPMGAQEAQSRSYPAFRLFRRQGN
jgi:hypothetical protein